jgi:hypothetical protein
MLHFNSRMAIVHIYCSILKENVVPLSEFDSRIKEEFNCLTKLKHSLRPRPEPGSPNVPVPETPSSSNCIFSLLNPTPLSIILFRKI